MASVTHQALLMAGGLSGAITPTTLNPSDKASNITLSGGNLIATFGSASDGAVRSVSSKTSGKYYVEFSPGATWSGGDCGFGIALGSASVGPGTGSMGFTVAGAAFVYAGANPPIWFNTVFAGVNLDPTGLGTCVGMAVDLDHKRLWYINYSTGNAWAGSTTHTTSDPATNSNGLDISALFPGAGAFVAITANQSGASATLNAGGSAFVGTVPSGFTAGWPA